MPDPSFDYLPTGLWGDEYREAGGIVVPDYLRQQAQMQDLMRQANEETQGRLAVEDQNAADEAQLAQWAKASEEFVDWPTYQQARLAEDKAIPYDAYNDYVTQAFPFHLQRMGYSPEEIQYEVQEFMKLVPRPERDYGFFGNLWESVKGGASSGTRAEQATGNLLTGDLDSIANLVVEQSAGEGQVGPLKQFQQQFSTDAAKGDLWEAIKAFAGSAVDNPQGGALFLAEQLAQSYPALAAGMAGMAVGTLAGPVGSVVGGVAGLGAGSASIEVGAGILERIATEAQQRGIDPRDGAAIAEMIRDPGVYSALRDAAVAKGLTVGAGDALLAAVSLGIGKYAAGAARAGNKLRAGGAAVGGLAGESIGAGGFELASQGVAGDEFDYSQAVAEAFGELGPGAVTLGMGAMLPSRAQPAAPGAPPPVIPGLGEDALTINNTEPPDDGGPPSTEGYDVADLDLMGVVEDINVPPVGPVEPLGVGSTNLEVGEPTIEEITLLPAQFIDTAEQRIADGRLLEFRPNPTLAVTPEGVVAEPGVLDAHRAAMRVSTAAAPQAIDLNVKDAASIAQWLEDRGVVLTPTQHAIAEDLAGTPPRLQRSYIADTIENLVASTDTNAEELAHGLLAIERTLPKDPAPKPAEAVAALVAELGVPPNKITSTLAQGVMADISAGVTNAPQKEPATTAAGATAVKRGLKAGEPLPTPSLSALANQLVGTSARSYESESGAAEAQTPKPGGGLRTRVPKEGTARRGLKSGATRGAVAGSAASNRVEPIDTAGAAGVSELAPPIEVKLSTTPTERRYGLQPEDVANQTALAQQRADERAKKGIRRERTKAQAKKLKREADVAAMSAEEYEKAYPGRSFQKDLTKLAGVVDKNGRYIDGAIVEDEDALSVGVLNFLTSNLTSSDAVLAYLAANARTPVARSLMDELRARGFDVPVIGFDANLDRRGVFRTYLFNEGHPNAYTAHEIIMGPRGGIDTLVHEIVHAATMEELLNPSSDDSTRARKKLEALMVYAKQHAPNQYGFTDVYEFVSEAFSNPAFQAWLQSMKLPNQTRFNLWTAFKQLILDLLGKGNTVLREALTAAVDLLSNELTSVEGFYVQRAESGATTVSKGAAPAKPKGAAVPTTAVLGVKNGVRTFVAYAKDKEDPNTRYTLYQTTPGNMRGDPDTKVRGLTRAEVDQYITADGSEIINPVTDLKPKSGTPKNTEKTQVGFSPEGVLHAAAFQQKDGTWTYYQSDADVRSDPDAKVSKGLTRDQVQRYITQAGYVSEAPDVATVKPDGTNATPIGYKPAHMARVTFQDFAADHKKIGQAQTQAGVDPTENIGYLANLNNSQIENRTEKMHKQYVQPARDAGRRVAQAYNKSDAQIMEVVKDLHVVERMSVKINQILRGNKPVDAQSESLTDLKAKQKASEDALVAARNSNPQYVQMIEQELAPKLKAMSDATLDMAAQYGLLTRQAVENMKASYNFYLPLQHGDRTTTGKAATGASVTTSEPFARMVEQMDSTIKRGENNRVVKAVADLVGGRGLIDLKSKEPVAFLGPELITEYNEKNNSLNDAHDPHTFDPNTIAYYDQGKRKTITVVDTPSLAAALKPFSGQERVKVLTALVSTMAWANRLIAIGKTSLSPMFAPYNFLRDIQTANINIPKGVSRIKFNAQLLNPATYGAVLWNVLKNVVGVEPSGGYAGAKEAGAFISHRSFVNLDAISHDLDYMFRPVGWKGLQAKRRWAQNSSFEALSFLSQFAESVPRYAMYKAAKASAEANGVAGKAAEMFAANAAKTSSVNFEQRGLKNLSKYWIFGNAKVQGLAALADTAKQQPLNATLGTMGLLATGYVMGSLALSLSDRDKDGKSKYTKIPNYKKDSMVIAKEGWFGPPISQEVSPIYVLGNAYAEYKNGATTLGDFASRVTTSFMNNFLWPGNVPQQELTGHKANVAEFIGRAMVPTVTLPGVDWAFNKNTFGSEVVPGLKDKLKLGIPKHEMGSATEDQMAVNVAKWLSAGSNGLIDVAPQQVKLVNNYLNPTAEGYAFFRDLVTDREPKYQGDIVNPIEKRFTANATGFYDQEQFDELRSQAARANYLATKNGIATLTPEDQALARSYHMLEKVNNDANSLFKGSKLMTQDRRLLLNERKREMVLTGIRRYNELRDRTVPQ